jgi:hypothetical protein
MDPKIWGNQAWFFLHAITLVYPDKPTKNDKINITNFFINTGKVLPCFDCRNNFNKHLIKFPITDAVLENRENIIKWLVNIHNEVNIINGKSKMNYEDVIHNYIKNDDYTYLYITILILLLLLLVILFIMIK